MNTQTEFEVEYFHDCFASILDHREYWGVHEWQWKQTNVGYQMGCIPVKKQAVPIYWSCQVAIRWLMSESVVGHQEGGW